MDPIVDVIRSRYLSELMNIALREPGNQYDNVDHMLAQLTWTGNTNIDTRLNAHQEYVDRDSLTVPELYLDPILPSPLSNAIHELPYRIQIRCDVADLITQGYEYLKNLLLDRYPFKVESAIVRGRVITSLNDRRDVSLTSDEFISLFVNPDTVGSPELDAILIFSVSVNDNVLRHVWGSIDVNGPDQALRNRIDGTIDKLFDEIWTIPRLPPIRRILNPTNIESHLLTPINDGMILIRPPVLHEQSKRMVELIDESLKKSPGLILVTYADVWNTHYFNYMRQSSHLEYHFNRVHMTIFVLSANK